MKNIIAKTVLSVSLCFALSACNLLDLSPIDNYSLNNYWNTEDQCTRFINGLHGRIRSRAQTFMIMGESRGGAFKTDYYTTIGQIASNYAINNNDLSLSSPGLTNWANFYMDIMQINHAIDNLKDGKDFLTNQECNYYLGQLYGMRAFYYFHLLRTWGGVPLVKTAEVLGNTSIDALNKPRSTEQETLQFIVEDVERSVTAFAEDNFTKPNGATFWNKAATYCLRAEIYLWRAKVKPIGSDNVFSTDIEADLNTALETLEAIEPKYSLVGKFADVFKTKNNAETIFAVRYSYGEAYNWFADFTYPSNLFVGFLDENNTALIDPLKVASGSMRYEYKLDNYTSMDDDDSRKRSTFFYFKNADATTEGIFLTKFVGEMYNNNRYFTDDYPIYRYADVLLMLAEVHNALNDDAGKLKNCIERVRQRAYGNSYPVFTYTDSEAAEEAILTERCREFVAEGKTWYDIRRMVGGRRALALVGGDARKLLWPIDADVLAKDPLVKQNDGYEY